MSDATPAQPTELPVPPTASTEGLPEYEPLTPEMVEDEAVRGDFVMKWAVILLAVLLACTVIAESATLVHVKTGQYLSSHGVLPPAKDVFSFTAVDRPWVNLNWLFDLITSAVYGAGAFIGLSIFKALLAGVAFGLVAHTSRPGISTWWGSICAALAVLVAQPRFTAQPELVTLVGIATCLWLLHQWLWNPSSRQVWTLIPVCILWSNLDSHAWWGPFLLLLYGTGECLGAKFGRAGVDTPQRRLVLWQVIGGCLVGLLINPFLWHSWLAPLVQFGTINPAIAAYASAYSPQHLGVQHLIHPAPWLLQPVVMAAAAVLFLTAGVLLIINRKRLDFGHLLMFFGAAAPAILAVNELAAAAVVYCVIATVNGQAWYAATSNRQYSTETRALLFSRGGRAVTVLILFALALLFTVGRLRPAGSAAVGLGLDPDLEGALKSYETVLKDSIDDRPFNFTLEQGDQLIWAGQKPFIDQRVAVYSGPTDTSLLGQFQKLRLALSPRKPGVRQTPQDVQFWKQQFDKYQVTHCLPRLGGNAPDYGTFGALLTSPYWQLTRLGSATAVFYRRDIRSPEVKAFLAKNQFDFGDAVFKTEAELLPPRAGWAELPTFYQRYIWKTNTRPSPEVREARHLNGLAGVAGTRGIGMSYQAIRLAQEGLSKNQNDAAAYAVLGHSYLSLLNSESQGQLNTEIGQFRYMQAVQVLNLGLIAAPDNLELHQLLYQLYSTGKRADLALREITFVHDWWSKQSSSDANVENAQVQELERANKEIDRISKYIAQVEAQAQKLPKEQQSNKLQLAGFYYQNGMPLKGLTVLQPAENEVSQPPQEMALRAELLMEAGQVEEAYVVAGQLEGLAQQMQLQDWQRPRVLTLLANAEYTLAAQIWTHQAEDSERAGAIGVLRSLIPRHFGVVGRPWPLTVTEPALQYFYSTPITTSSLNFYAALVYLEAGQVKRATEMFRLVLNQNPGHPQRLLIAFYLEKLTGQWVDFVPPADRVPIEFAPE